MADTGTASAQGDIGWTVIASVACMFAGMALVSAGELVAHLADNRLTHHLRLAAARRLAQVPLGWFTSRASGEVKQAMQDDIAMLHSLTAHFYTAAGRAVGTILISVIYLFALDWRLAMAALLPFPGFFLFLRHAMKAGGANMPALAARMGGINSAAAEFVGGIPVVKAFGTTGRVHGGYREAVDAFAQAFTAFTRPLVAAMAHAHAMIAPVTVLGVVLAFGAWFVGLGWIAPVDVLPFALVAPGICAPLLLLHTLLHDLGSAKGAAQRVQVLLETPVLEAPGPEQKKDFIASTAVPEKIFCVKQSKSVDEKVDKAIKNKVTFDNVGYAYGDGQPVLSNISFALEPGTVTAIVGPSGAGKSTLARLLLRFFDPGEGRITLGGVDLRHIATAQLYRSIGFVLQEVCLIHASVRDNIALGRPEASQQEIEEAARAASIHERILALPRGYDSVVGEDAQLFRRRTPARQHRACRAARPARAGAGRGHGRRRCRQRSGAPGGAVPLRARPQPDGHCAPARYGDARRPHPRAPGRPHRRTGHAPAAPGAGWPLCAAVGVGGLRRGRAHFAGADMLKTFVQLLGEDAPVFRRYAWMAVLYGVLCGLTIAALVPVLTHLLGGEVRRVVPWLAALLAGVLVCWGLRRHVERAGVRVGVAILQGARHRLGDHVACLPVGWFTPQNTARLGHAVTQGMMAVAQLPAHVFTPVIAGVVTPVVLVAVLLVLHWPLGLIAALALPLLAGVQVLTGRLARRADEAFHQRFAEASQRVVEFAQAQSVLRAFNGEGGSTRWLEQVFAQQRQAGTRLIWLSAGSAVLNAWAVQAVFAALLGAAALWMSGHLLDGGLVAEDAIAAIVSLLLVSRFIDALLEVAGYGEVLRSARGQLDAIGELLAVKPRPQAEAPQAPCDASVELRDAHFATRRMNPRCCAG